MRQVDYELFEANPAYDRSKPFGKQKDTDGSHIKPRDWITHRGWFQGWGIEGDSGEMHTVAIVENDDGTVVLPDADRIQFLTPPV